MKKPLRYISFGLGWATGFYAGTKLFRFLLGELKESDFLKEVITRLNSLYGDDTTEAPPPKKTKTTNEKPQEVGDQNSDQNSSAPFVSVRS